jgi:hypothetical protein
MNTSNLLERTKQQVINPLYFLSGLLVYNIVEGATLAGHALDASINLGGADIQLALVANLAALIGAAVISDFSFDKLSRTMKYVFGSLGGVVAIVQLFPSATAFVTGSLAAGIMLYMIHGALYVALSRPDLGR